MNMVIRIGLYERPIISWQAEKLIAFHEGIFSHTRSQPQGRNLQWTSRRATEKDVGMHQLVAGMLSGANGPRKELNTPTVSTRNI
jgi:hypothetical protein